MIRIKINVMLPVFLFSVISPIFLYAEPRVVGTYPLSQFGLSNPYGIAFDSKRNEVWVTGVHSNNLVIINAATKKPVTSIGNLNNSYLIAIDSERNRTYVAGYYQIQVYDTSSRSLLKTFNLTNTYMDAFTLDHVDGDIYISGYFWDSAISQWRQGISRYDFTNFTLKSRFIFPENAYYYAWNILVKQSKIYIPLVRYDYYTSAYDGWLWILDKTNLTLLQKVSFGVSSWPSGIKLDDRDSTLYVADFMDKVWVLQPNAAGQMAITTAITGLTSPWNIDLDTATSRLYCPDNYSNFVYVVDIQSKKVIKTLQGGYDPSNVVIDNKQGLAFVANYLSNDVSVFDLKTDTLNSTIDLRIYTPYDIALIPNSDKTLITAGMSNGILTWNRATGQVENFTEDRYYSPASMALFPNLNKAFFQSNSYKSSYLKKFFPGNNTISFVYPYIWSTGGMSAREETGQLLVSQSDNPSPPYGSALSILDAASETVLKTIPLGLSSNFPKGIASNPNTGKAYVVLYAAHQVAVTDLAQGTNYKNIPVGYYPEAVAVNTVLNKIYVSNYGSNSISVIDGLTDSVIATIPVGKSPKGIAVKKKGNRVYVANSGENTVTVIDGRLDQVVSVLPVGGSPQNVRVDESSERIYVTNYSSASITVIEDIAIIDTKPPNILHTPVMGPVPEHQPVVVRAEVTDDMAVAMVTLTFWGPNQGQYWTVPMKNISGSTYEATIPADFLMSLQGNEVAYFIDATDFEGNGPPTGQTPGTSANPNKFTVQKSIVKLWNYAFGHVYGGFYRMIPGPSAAIDDIREDLPGLEIATGNEEFYPLGYPGPMGRWFLFNNTGGVVFWKDTQNDEAHSSVNLYDLDGDNKLEMLGGTTSGNQIQAFDRFGKWFWRYILGSHAISTPAVEKLSANGNPVVFAGSFDKYLRSIDGKTGTLNWAFPSSNWIWNSPAVADLDADGTKEVVFASDMGTPNFYVLNASNGTLKWSASISGSVRSSAGIADLNSDGIKEVLIGSSNGTFYCFNGKTGTLLWTFQTGGEIVSSAAIGDLDGNNTLEIVFGSGDGFLYVLDGKGALRWKTNLGSPIFSSPALAKRTPDKRLDIYIITLAGRLAILRGTDGVLLGGFQVDAQVVSSPIVGDVDGDGKLEIFFQDRKGDVNSVMAGDRFWALRDMNSSVSPYAKEWPMFRRDSAHTGLYPLLPPAKVTGLSVNAPPEGGSLKLTWNANPEPDIAFYKIYRNGEFKVQLNSLTYTDTGLTDGETYIYQISAVDKTNQEGEKSDSVSGIPRDILPPVSKILSPQDGAEIFATSVNISGTAQDNGIAGIKKVEIRISDLQENTITWVLASGTDIFSFDLTDLKDNHTYKIASRAEDNEGNQERTPVDIQFSVILPPSAVTGLTATLGTSGKSATLNWNPVSEPDIAGYRIYSEDGNLIAVTISTIFELENLAYDTQYTYYVSAIDLTGLESPKTSVSFTTPVNGTARATIKVPKDGKKIWGNAVTIMADACDFTVKVVFQYQKEGKSGWTDISSPDSKPPYAVYWNVSDARISTGTYYLRAVAYDSNGLPDLSPSTIRVIVDDANADIVEDGNPEVDPNKPHRKEEKISSVSTAEEVVMLDGTKVIIPPGAVPEGERIQIQVVSENEISAQSLKSKDKVFKSRDKVLKPAGVFRKFTFANGTSQFKEKLTLIFPVPDENEDGIVDGTDIKVSSLKAYYFSESKQEWICVGTLNTSVQISGTGTSDGSKGQSPFGDSSYQKSISVEVDHFTLFGLFQEQEVSSALQIGEIYAFPNPARLGKQPTLHIEVGEADKLEIKIYDISGDMVHSKDINSPPSIIDGKYAYRYQWDTSSVPSGIYIFSVKAYKGSQSVQGKGKIALIK